MTDARPTCLATTALSEFWSARGRVTFLGTWCTRYDRRAEWADLDAETMPSPWDDRKRFYDAVRYVDECAERMLGRLAEALNATHGVHHDTRYWRVLIGPWLLHAIHTFYDRYAHLDEALRRYGPVDTIVLDPAAFRTPRDGAETIDWLCDDLFNLQLFSQLLDGLGHRFPSRWPDESERSIAGSPRGTAFADGLRTGARRVERAVARACHRDRWVAVCDVAAPRAALWQLAGRSGLRAVPIRPEFRATIDCRAVLDAGRLALGGLAASDEFERLWVGTLPQNFPALYLEGYAQARRATLTEHRTFPAAIVSETGWYASEAFRFFAAEAAARGTRLVTAQHGGAYGIRRAMPVEWHEARLGHAGVVWGTWGDELRGRYLNWPPPRTWQGMSAPRESPGAAGVLFTATGDPRYLHYFHSRPTGSHWTGYLDWHLRFLGALPSRLRSVAGFRAHPIDYGHSVVARVRDRFPEVASADHGSFRERMAQSRVVVVDHCGTALVEALNANVPTVLVWDPERWEARADAEPHRARLRDVGILYDTPEAAAARTAALYDDPSLWGDRDLQAARRAFVERYGHVRDGWVRAWAGGLREMCR